MKYWRLKKNSIAIPSEQATDEACFKGEWVTREFFENEIEEARREGWSEGARAAWNPNDLERVRADAMKRIVRQLQDEAGRMDNYGAYGDARAVRRAIDKVRPSAEDEHSHEKDVFQYAMAGFLNDPPLQKIPILERDGAQPQLMRKTRDTVNVLVDAVNELRRSKS